VGRTVVVYPGAIDGGTTHRTEREGGTKMADTAVTEHDLYPTRVAEERDTVRRDTPTIAGTDRPGPFTADELRRHDERGFSILPGFLSSEEVSASLGELGRLQDDPALRNDERLVTEADTGQVRSVFDVHLLSDLLGALARDGRLVERARQILGTDVYLHQTRINYQPGFTGSGFYWHSDFETWHAEDGMPTPHCVSCQIALTDNLPYNGGLMVMPGSHRLFVPCVGETPQDNFRSSLKAQTVGVPSHARITEMAEAYGIEQFTGPAGTALWFDSNIMHGSGNNITPFPRSNIFMVFNSVENRPEKPYSGTAPRPEHIAHRTDTTPL